MKTIKTTQPLFLLFIIFCYTSCCLCKLCQLKVRHHESEAEKVWHDTTTNNTIRRQFIVSFHDNISKEDSAFLLNIDTVAIKDSCACGKLFLLDVAPEIIPEDLLASRPRKPRHEGATFYNLRIQLNTIPKRNFSLGVVSKQNEKRFAYIPTPAFTLKSLDPRIKIALIDAGLPADDFFIDKIWRNPDEFATPDNIDNDGNCYIDDIAGFDFTTNTASFGTGINKHGSYVGQILLNSLHLSPEVALMDLKIFDEEGNGNLFDALCAIQYSIDNGADFINLSWGYYRHIDDTLGARSDSLLLYYINKANKANIPVFASAGNDTLNTDIEEYHYPSGFFSENIIPASENLISVAALSDSLDQLAVYSNFGPKSVQISTVGSHKVENLEYLIGNGIAGTSYATPYALGYAVKLKRATPGITPSQLKECLVKKSIFMGFPIRSEGKLNLYDTTKCE